jgi:primosomal replication protein N
VDNNYSLPFASCFIYRDNRCFGTFPFIKLLKGNGHRNYTIHQIFYENKKYNLYFGVNSSKGNLVKRDCELINFMEGVLKKIQGDLATDYILKHESTIQVKEEQQKQAEKKKIEALKKEEKKKIEESLRKEHTQQEELPSKKQVECNIDKQISSMTNEQLDEMIKIIKDNNNESLSNVHLLRYFNENCILFRK